MSCVRDLALLLGAAAAAAAAAPGTLAVGLEKRRPAAPPRPPPLLRPRGAAAALNASVVALAALNNVTAGGYLADLGVGTPPQPLTVQLDTGSSDTWVNAAGSAYCADDAQQSLTGYCTATFDPAKSSTYALVSQAGFSITYLDGRRISGSYFNDTVTVGGRPVAAQQLGLALSSDRPSGIMGLGLRANVAARAKYPTLVDTMVAQGVIDRPCFSLYLNDIGAQSGSVLFGGIDTAKFSGGLAVLPLQPLPARGASSSAAAAAAAAAANVTSYAVSIRGVAATGLSLPAAAAGSVAVLDSGSTVTLVPGPLADQLQSPFGVAVVSYRGESTPPLVDCAYAGPKGSGVRFDFLFDGVTVAVPMREMVVDALPALIRAADPEALGLPSRAKDWQGICLFGIGSSSAYGVQSDRFYLLGDTFLRSAYVAYDMQALQVGLAQASLNATESNIVALSAASTGLPQLTGTGRNTTGAGTSSQGNAAGRPTPSFLAASALMALAFLCPWL
ncbi:uncharacterized protein UV8b_02236 [Ustilaginoidea virens]|uniref:Peptidase A1 domain-containing protein n=1 Tax=Ustilaginoidea virens TaxID=1159556 RepID=A0A8E5HM38_USTVR|nr:uncharacterized protein UV8b_02236 [Ustilaginoidea virens]QUC17995.1 hypothetical protein UV8b_02236 [Ustilaginoidea virens]